MATTAHHAAIVKPGSVIYRSNYMEPVQELAAEREAQEMQGSAAMPVHIPIDSPAEGPSSIKWYRRQIDKVS
jgi:hypothetical protein